MSLADLIKKGSLRRIATATDATVATHGADYSTPDPPPEAPVATVASVAVAEVQNSPADGESSSDRI